MQNRKTKQKKPRTNKEYKQMIHKHQPRIILRSCDYSHQNTNSLIYIIQIWKWKFTSRILPSTFLRAVQNDSK